MSKGQQGKPWWNSQKKSWYVWIDGRQERLGADREAAFRAWHKLVCRPRGVTIRALVSAFQEARRGQQKASTQATQAAILRALVREQGDLSAGSLDGLAWLNAHPGWSQSYRWLVASVLKALTRWGTSQGLLTADPLAGWKVPGPTRRTAAVIPEKEAWDRLLSTAPGHYLDVLLFLHATGCRPGEVCSLEAQHIDCQAGLAVLPVHKTDRTGRPRVIVLPAEALAIVGRLAAVNPVGPLFRGRSGLPLRRKTLSGWFRSACRRLGLPEALVPYSCRHRYATDALASGVPDSLVAELLGHRGTRILHDRYSHLSARLDALRQAADRIRKPDQ